MSVFQFIRIVPLLLLAFLCSCGIQPHRISVGTTVATSEQIPIVLQTILDYDESGGKVPFFSRFLNPSKQKQAATSLLKAVEIVERNDGGHTETWLVDAHGQEKAFTVTFFHGPGGNPFGADGCWIRDKNIIESNDASATEQEAESVHRFKQQTVRDAFRTYLEKNYSFSRQFGIIMPKVFAYSHEGAWGIGVSGLQDCARSFALEKCEAMRQPADSKCLIVSIDGKWTQ